VELIIGRGDQGAAGKISLVDGTKEGHRIGGGRITATRL
jgi:hypothetical protein